MSKWGEHLRSINLAKKYISSNVKVVISQIKIVFPFKLWRYLRQRWQTHLKWPSSIFSKLWQLYTWVGFRSWELVHGVRSLKRELQLICQHLQIINWIEVEVGSWWIIWVRWTIWHWVVCVTFYFVLLLRLLSKLQFNFFLSYKMFHLYNSTIVLFLS